MKLTSLTDFVLEQEKAIPNKLNIQPTKEWDRLFVKRIISYAQFLKQPLTLGMFVPCDENGSIVSNLVADDNYFGVHIYEKAKERILFKGFTLSEIGCIVAPNKLVTGELNDDKIVFYYDLEGLINRCDLELTESAIATIKN